MLSENFRKTFSSLLQWSDKFIILILMVKSFQKTKVFFQIDRYNIGFLILGALLPVFMIVLALSSKNSKNYRLSKIGLIGIILSFGGFAQFSKSQLLPQRHLLILSFSNLIFYTLFILYAYVSMGRNFGIVPALRGIVTKGPFRLVRHPIYAAFFCLASNFLFLNFTLNNFICTCAIACGLALRIIEEEKLLIASDSYQEFSKATVSKVFSIWLFFPLFLFVFVKALTSLYAIHDETMTALPSIVSVQLAFPVTSLNPVIYDDWSSVFVGNHIYRRLFNEKDRPEISTVTDSVKFECVSNKNDANIDHCERLQISFVVKPFQDCLNRTIDANVVRHEFETILTEKTWILPNWKRCTKQNNYATDLLCYEVHRIPDIKRRLHNLYFRFGWSLASQKDSIFGSGPFCLNNVIQNAEYVIQSGTLKPAIHNSSINSKSILPIIDINTSESADLPFHIALYGTKELLKGHRVNVQTHTPLAYYLVTNKMYKHTRMPWNTERSRKIIVQHMTRSEMLFPVTTKLHEIVPVGTAIESSIHLPKYHLKKRLTLMLPDYFPNCSSLAETLNQLWRNESENAEAICGNTSKLTEDFTKRNFTEWQGMLSPLSPGAPGRNAIRYQYFSPLSKESWTSSDTNPDSLFYCLGMGQSLATVDNEKICGLKPNSMGLGDVFITDLIPCNF